MAEEQKTEPWLRGTLNETPSVIRAVLHALELAREDVDRWCSDLSDAEINAKPSGLAPVAFQLRHIARSLDRLLTYADGRMLDGAQLDSLRSEMEGGGAAMVVLEEFRSGIDSAMKRVATFVGADLEEARAVGKRKLPTSLGGLLVHVADHTQRHVGQAITTSKVVLAQRNAPS